MSLKVVYPLPLQGGICNLEISREQSRDQQSRALEIERERESAAHVVTDLVWGSGAVVIIRYDRGQQHSGRPSLELSPNKRGGGESWSFP
jgi:hypothetical protein